MCFPVYRNVPKVDQAWLKKYASNTKRSAALAVRDVCLKNTNFRNAQIHRVVC